MKTNKDKVVKVLKTYFMAATNINIDDFWDIIASEILAQLYPAGEEQLEPEGERKIKSGNNYALCDHPNYDFGKCVIERSKGCRRCKFYNTMEEPPPQQPSEGEIDRILKGIDMEVCESDDGWWETSVGSEYGAQKLREIKQLLNCTQSDAQQRYQKSRELIYANYPELKGGWMDGILYDAAGLKGGCEG